MLKSKLHRRVLSLLPTIFGKASIQEEVAVNSLFKEFKSKRERYDIVIPLFNIIIECHGIQHETMQSFGEKQGDKIRRNFISQKRRDSAKEQIAIENNWNYVIVWYNELPDADDEAANILRSKFLNAAQI